MARWLRDADTGELFREDELDPSSYESISDWEPIDSTENDSPQYEYPEWLTSGLTSIPAKTLGSLASGGASAERMLGDLFANVPGLEDNWLQRNAAVNRQAIDDLLSQTRKDNNQEPGSFRDIATSATGAALGGLSTLGTGLALNAGRKALAVMPALFPSADKYSALRDEGVSGLDASIAAGESLALNSLLNRFDVGAALSPGPTGRRILQSGTVGSGTNLFGAYADALIDKSVGAAQTPEEFYTNLATAGAAGGLMGAGFAGLASPRVNADTTVPEGQSAANMLAQMEQDAAPQSVSDIAPQPGIDAFNDYANDPFQVLKVPPAYGGGNTIVPEADVPLIDPGQPQPEPLIQVEDGYRARDLVSRQRELENMFLPEGSELATLRQTGPSNPKQVIPGSRTTKPATEPVVLVTNDEFGLSPIEREAANKVRVASNTRIRQAQIAENEAGLRELLAKMDETRRPVKASSMRSDKELTLRIGEQNASFPEPIIKNLSELSQRPATRVQLPPGAEVESSPLPLSLVPDRLKPPPQPGPDIQLVEGYQSRNPPEVINYDPLADRVSQLARGPSNLVFEADVPIIGQDPAPIQSQEIISPDAANTTPGSLYIDPQSEIGVQRAAAQRLVNAERQQAPSLITEEGYSARTPEQIAEAQEFRRQVEMIGLQPREQLALFTEDEVARIKPEGTLPDDARRAIGKRAATRRKAPVTSKEAGFVNLSDLEPVANWIRGRFVKAPAVQKANDLPDYQAWSKTNKRYDKGTWGRTVEWMDTTARKNPEAAKFIEGQWKIPQDTAAIVWDADATLDAYNSPDLTPAERRGVDSYLQAARVLGSRDAGYVVNPETAAKAGLSGKQVQAAIAVKNWSNLFADMFENEALAQAEHNAEIATIKAPPSDAYKTAIATKLAADKVKIGETFSEWRKSNYVPFDRYGDHFLNVFDANDNLIARQQFESPKDPDFAVAKRHYEELAKQPGEFFGATIKYGRQDPARLVQFDGASKDLLDILGKDAEGEPITGFSRHLKNAKLIKGQNPDLERAISSYTVGAARLLAFRRANRVAEIELATTLRGDDKINLANKLKEWKTSLNTPTSEAFKAINEAFNFAYIGGNARTPTADLIGALHMQPLVLSKHLKGMQPEAVAVKTIGNLAKWYAGKGIDPTLAAGLKEAQKKNIIPDDTLKKHMRKSRGPSKTMQGLSQAKDAYFILKSASERFVDAGAFMSGWEAWKRLPPQNRKGVSQQQFAENMVREMRAVPSQMELPANALFKTETGRLITKYRLFQTKILKALGETSLPGAVRYMVSVGMTTGLMGLPFVGREAFSALRAAGYEPEDKLRKEGAGSALMYGPLSKATGIDFSGSAGYGEVFPLQSANPFQKMALGIVGAPAEALQRAGQFYARGQTDRAIASLPISNLLSNYLTQADWGDRGVVTMGGKAVIPKDEVAGADRIKKLLGYQPLAVKEAMVLENRKKQAASQAVDNDHINQRIGEAEGLGDYKTADALRQMASEKGLRINKQSIRRYRDMIQGKDKKYPKAARALIDQLEETYGTGD